ncbi:ABC transporter permease [Fibrisoma montanum]|uniref:ABC transporter permease n=1 Tax=Fibrisoma montanum TaxID=2305895 RepID=A0A418M6F0_9BACT|nr:permease prefix domain 2-containing transporter [Fibrisoma montanum]RIV21335.1 ABC transporter permease [Fibrisoma montanum]
MNPKPPAGSPDRPTPPRLADRLLEWFVAPHRLETLQGDLHEEFAYQVGRVGEQRARWRYWREVLGFIRPYVIKRKSSEYPTPTNFDMIRNYLKITLRQLWYNRMVTLLNVLGLSIGLATCWVVYRMASFEFSFNTNHPAHDRIYRVVSRSIFDGKESGNPGVPIPMLNVIRAQLPGADLSVPVFEQRMQNLQVLRPKKGIQNVKKPKGIFATEPDYFSLVSNTFLIGSAAALSQPYQVILTQNRATQYFPGMSSKEVIGQEIIYWDTLRVRVAGVVTDPPINTDFVGHEFLSLSSMRLTPDVSEWGEVSATTQVFVRLNANAQPSAVERRLNALAQKYTATIHKEGVPFTRWHLLQPLSDLHFDADYANDSRTASKELLYGLMSLAGFILLLATINYVNLVTALVPQRAREISIRKTLGSSRWLLVVHFLCETLLVVSLAMLIAFALTNLFFTGFGDLLPAGTAEYTNPPLAISFAIVLSLVVTSLAGIYPGWLIARLQPLAGLQKRLGIGLGSSTLTLRKSLIVFQFIISQTFIVGTLLMGQQLRFALGQPMGFNREAVVLARTPYWDYKDEGRRFVLKTELQKLPGIAAISLGDAPATDYFNNNVWSYQGKKGKVSVSLYRKFIDTDYLKFYGIPLLAGRNVLPSDTIREYVINEAAAKAFGFKQPKDAVGKILTEEEGASFPVVGVVKDFHSQSFHEKISPTVLLMTKSNLLTVNIKLAFDKPAYWQQTLEQAATKWKEFYPDEPFEYRFYDAQLADFYQNEMAQSRIINLATAVSILISCFGLFGLATLISTQRTKEIGVRKILGASVASIVALLSKDFLKLVLVAIIIASPIAWYGMHQWLQGFAYKIDIEWWMFALAGVLATVVTILTVCFQAIKAALMNPVKSLRNE